MNPVLETLLAIGALVGGVGYFIGQFKKGRSDGKKDDLGVSESSIKIFREQIEGLQKLVADQRAEHQKEMRELRDEVIRLQTLLGEKEKKLKEYGDIVKGRDPAVLNILNKLSDVAVGTSEEIKGIGKTLENVEDFMEKTAPLIDVIAKKLSPTS